MARPLLAAGRSAATLLEASRGAVVRRWVTVLAARKVAQLAEQSLRAA